MVDLKVEIDQDDYNMNFRKQRRQRGALVREKAQANIKNEPAVDNIPIPGSVVRRKPQAENLRKRKATTPYAPEETRLVPAVRKLDFITGEEGEGWGSYKALELNIKFASNVRETNTHQKSVYYAASLACLVPSLHDDITQVCRDMQLELSVLRLPKHFLQVTAGTNEKRELGIDVCDAAAMWGLIVLMLYKNPSEEFCRRRLRALCSRAGPIKDGLMVFRTMNDAKNFRMTFGHNHRMRKSVLTAVLDLSRDSGPIAKVCCYLKSFLEWTDLDDYFLIDSSLFLTESPVLELDDMQIEVKNFSHATHFLEGHELPSYYRILGDPTTFVAFERQNFPTLLAVARELKARTDNTVARFVPPGVDPVRVKKLVLMQLRSNKVGKKILDCIRFLTGEDED